MKKKASGRRTRRTHNPAFKAQVGEWKKQLLERAAEVFAGEASPEPVNLVPLHAKIGQLALENDFLESALTKAGLLSAKP